MPAAKNPRDNRPLKWTSINDFTPGIISQSNHAFSASTAPVPGTAPGAAQMEGTFNCIALPNGGLGPLPGLVKTIASPIAVPIGATSVVNGCHVHGQIGTSDEVVFGIETLDAASNRSFSLWSFVDQSNTMTGILAIVAAASTENLAFSPLTGDMTRVNPTNAQDVGAPCLALAYTSLLDSGIVAYNWLYPDPANNGSVTHATLSNSQIGFLLTHQNRIVILTSTNYAWIGAISGQPTLMGTNEAFNYTDPPNSNTMGSQDEVFVQEHPWGVGAWGSISAGELFLVKHQGGGYIISGDLNFPSVTYLGGVTPTKYAYNQVAQSPIGLIYASNRNGVWVWAGGSGSTLLSENLNDDFYAVWPPLPGGVPYEFLFDFSADTWGSWIAMTNGYIFDFTTQGFWRYPNPFPDGAAPLYVGSSFDGQSLYMVANQVTAAGNPVIAKYSIASPSNSFSWTSYPMPQSIDQTILVAEVVIRAQGVGTVTVTVTGIDGTETTAIPVTAEFSSDSQPQLVRTRPGVTAQDATITIVSTGAGTGPAPIVYSLAIGWELMNLVNAT